ncbi:hypothetical protein AD998_12265 [bacterium 336/3]|nr:hypothetical protein AD998_12265 [bacterium 336/3]
MEKIELKGFFTLIDFSVTHKLLLLRKSDFNFDKVEPLNTDIIFAGVAYLELDTIFEDITISKLGDKHDIEYFRQRSCIETYDDDFVIHENIFVLESQGKKFYIVARDVIIENNNYDSAKTSLKPKWRNIDYENHIPKDLFQINPKSTKENSLKASFDDEYIVKITIKFDFSEFRENNTELLHRSLLFQYLKENDGKTLTFKTHQQELFYYCMITCNNKDFYDIFDTSLNVLLQDNSYNLVEYDSYTTNLINQLSYSLSITYDNRSFLKITKTQLKKYKMLKASDISFNSISNPEFKAIHFGGYLQMYFTAQNAETALRKIEESWSLFFSKKYFKYQETAFHIFPDTHDAFFAVSIEEDFLISDNIYLDVCSFLNVYNLFLSENNIETYLVVLHNFYHSSIINPHLFSDVNLVLIRNSTPSYPSFLDIYQSFI